MAEGNFTYESFRDQPDTPYCFWDTNNSITAHFHSAIELILMEEGSASRFSHLFNQNIGCNLPRYLNILRTGQAVHLIRYEHYSAVDAAAACGYRSMRSFYRVFRQIYGMTPSEYLEQ